MIDPVDERGLHRAIRNASIASCVVLVAIILAIHALRTFFP